MDERSAKMKIRYLLPFVPLLMVVSAQAQDFVVTNKMPAFTVVNRCEDCCDPFAMTKKMAEAKARPFIIANLVPVKTITQVITTTRAPQGHTHTCPKCGTTWDHASNPSHNCPNCGTPQYVVDRGYRPVTVRKTIQVPVQQPPQKTAPTVTQTMSALSRATYVNCSSGG